MKAIFPILLSLSFFPLYSQPTLTSANDASTGSSFIFELADTAGISEGAGGIMQTWDFSAVTQLGIQKAESWVDPVTTPFQSLYPSATIVQRDDDGIGGFIYSYVTQNTAHTELNGIVTTINPTAVDMHYTDPLLLRQYPATFNDTLEDYYEGMSFMTLGPITAHTYRSGNYRYLVDGYGTLITPAKTYPHTLRIKLRQEYTDSTTYIGVPIPPVIVHVFSTTYFWASADAGDKLYQFYVGYDTTMTGSISSNFMSVSYQGIGTGLEENIPFESSSFYIYPNPAIENFTIHINDPESGQASLCIYDSKGLLVKSVNVQMIKNEYFEWRFSVSGLANGIYTAKVSCNNKNWITRVLKL